MPWPAFLAVAAKLIVLAAAAATAANAASYARFRRRHLRRIRSPIDESADPVVDFRSLPSSATAAEDDDFFFGLATAPAHVEDRLDDAWLQFATEQSVDDKESMRNQKQVDAVMASAGGDGGSQPSSRLSGDEKGTDGEKRKPLRVAMEAMLRGFEKFSEGEESSGGDNCSHNVAAWHNVPCPQERLKFWSDPDTELKLAKETGVSVFRMGVDWTRIMPKEPTEDFKSSVNFAALERYRWIIQRVHEHGMKVMLTLFHHSLPPWAGEYGGWRMEKTANYFMDFVRLVVDRVSDLVDYWVIFNEPHVFVMLTYCAGAWPGGDPNAIEVATSALPTGVYNQALHWIAVAHAEAYDYIHSESKNAMMPIVGVSHHVSFTRPYGLFDVAAVTIANSMTLFPFIDSICDKLDFIGINYYGQEVISGPGLKHVENDEYSESGRGVYPDGLFRILLKFNERYKSLNIPFIITENGVSDETDLIRKPYILEHLLAIYAAILMGVRVVGYLFWTTSDNWEWADGYGPKFGLVSVDRANNLARKPRPSYYLFTKVVTTGKITRQDRTSAWRELQEAAIQKKTRPFYREVDKHGRMYAGGLDRPIERTFVLRDWRFGHYEMEGLQDPLSRFVRCVMRPFPRRKIHYIEDDAISYSISS
ncbi:beta-glucosidase-like SFR2, chloroplastic isoform X1 [Triticum aestivum]|uniref:beta-glucosidase-like SFR2, chloroplastic isoform X1 n=1 Tax=Triticum aestivum TaxID=4565 RepID=UPI001D013F01|nr:beta-glucosidase-like SFR2, chloroplastic isoform X1 [Triticum aestivum]